MLEKQNIQILVVDDEQEIQEALKTHLELEGYPVMMASSAFEALDILKKEPIKIVITDINMPKMDGLELLENIKRARSEAIVIMITAYTSMTKVMMSQVHGAFDYILKPFRDLDELDGVMGRALELIERWEKILEETKKVKIDNRSLNPYEHGTSASLEKF